MNILITGGTGLIGSELVNRLSPDHDLTVLTRSKQSAEQLSLRGIKSIHDLDEWTPDQKFDAIINLAGEPIVDRRWTARRKAMLINSRVTLTQKIVEKIERSENKPSVLISGSAVGIYGDSQTEIFSENNEIEVNDFGAYCCKEWEKAALRAEDAGVRTCIVRTGIVLSAKGGMLKKLLLPFRLGLGGKIGHGNQWLSWIHIDDQVDAILHLFNSPSSKGIYNLTAPQAVTNQGFTASLGKAVKRPTWFSVPAFVIKAALGEASLLLLGGQRVAPERLLAEGFRFKFERLDAALDHLLD